MTYSFNSRKKIKISSREYAYYSLEAVAAESDFKLEDLPFSLRPVLESVLRHTELGVVSHKHDTLNLFEWQPEAEQPEAEQRKSIPYFPGRILLQDFTGVPVMNDLAAMRMELQRVGSDPAALQPVIPVDLVIDHSVQLDFAGFAGSFEKNIEREYERNLERYTFLRWCQDAFDNFRVVPPSKGIVHQINLEYLAQVVMQKEQDGEIVLYPDTLLGTDSHTTMVNGLGVVGWGVGGLEATAAMLGQPIEIVIPDVVGFELTGSLRPGVTPTDLTLMIIHLLRKTGVVGKFVEFYGSGLQTLTLADRAMIANMTPESGATMLYFPIDEQTLEYLRATGRSAEHVELVRAYTSAQQMLYNPSLPTPKYSQALTLDLAGIQPGLAGPRRPQDFIPLGDVKQSFQESLASLKTGGNGDDSKESTRELKDGALAIAAITSCTNTSNPTVMLTAGLLAQNAVRRGLKPPFYTKTSLTPGSRVVTDMLAAADLLEPLETLGFHVSAYGCATCIGNTGPLHPEITQAVREHGMVAASVLSGNRNFEGRISPDTLLNYLASPPLVVAYALAGTIEIDLTSEPLGTDQSGDPVFLRDLWPSSTQVSQALRIGLSPSMFNDRYSAVFEGDEIWEALPAGFGLLYRWEQSSTYLLEPPFFGDDPTSTSLAYKGRGDIAGARILAIFGDSVTTDHISPAGNIPLNSLAGRFLQAQGVANSQLNTYGARRGNHEVMMRGTFANPRLKNLLVPDTEGAVTVFWPDRLETSIYDAAVRYHQNLTPLVIFAGREYGTGSSRDWAAKGPALLGVKAVFARSFERIHRSNLAGMGILPLELPEGLHAGSLGLEGDEWIDIPALPDDFRPQDPLIVTVRKQSGETFSFNVTVRLDTPAELFAYRHGGILRALLRKHTAQKNDQAFL